MDLYIQSLLYTESFERICFYHYKNSPNIAWFPVSMTYQISTRFLQLPRCSRPVCDIPSSPAACKVGFGRTFCWDRERQICQERQCSPQRAYDHLTSAAKASEVFRTPGYTLKCHMPPCGQLESFSVISSVFRINWYNIRQERETFHKNVLSHPNLKQFSRNL